MENIDLNELRAIDQVTEGRRVLDYLKWRLDTRGHLMSGDPDRFEDATLIEAETLMMQYLRERDLDDAVNPASILVFRIIDGVMALNHDGFWDE